MANRKRKSSALPDISTQPGSATPSASPSVSRHKRTKRVNVTATQQLEEEAHLIQEQQALREEETTDAIPEETIGSKRASKGLTVSVGKPHTPPDSLSPDIGHPPSQFSPHLSPSGEATEVHVRHQAIRSHLNEHVDAADVQYPLLADTADPTTPMNTALLLPPGAVVAPQTPTIRPDPTAELEIQQFEEVTTTLQHDIASVQAAMKILVTEVKALGFAEADAGTDIILANIRAAFRDARMQLNELLPQADANSYQNGELLPLLTANIRSLLLTIGDQTQIIKDMKLVEQDYLVKQTDLVQELAASEKRKKDMSAIMHKTDMLADKRAKEVVSLEDEIRDLRDQCERQAASIADRDATVEALNGDIDAIQDEANELDTQLIDARENLEATQTKLVALEKDHRHRVAQLKQDYSTAIEDLQGLLREEQASQDAVKQENRDKATRISELETEVGDLNGDMETLKSRLVDSKKQLDDQTDRNQTLTELLDERQTFILELESKISETEGKLDEFLTQFDELRTMANSERRQREAAEEDLDECSATIETLSSRVKEAGVESNQLKSKIFETQKRHENELNELQQLLATTQDRFESDLSAEQDAHAAAADRVGELTNVVVPGLKLEMKKIEDDFEQALAAKNDLLIKNETIVRELQDSLGDIKQQADDFAQEKTREVQSLHADLAQLNVDVNDRNNLIRQLEAKGLEGERNHRDELLAKEALIRELNKELDEAQREVVSLEGQKASLEARVEHEATTLLMDQNKHADEIDGLKASLKTRDHEIGKLLNEAEAAREKWAQTLAGRDERIMNLEDLAESRKLEVETLIATNEEIKEALVEAVKLSREKISNVNAITAAAHAASQNEEQSLLHDTEALLQKADSMSTPVSVIKQTTTYVPQRRSPRVARKTAKKRAYHDSGIFDAGSSEVEESTQEMEEIMA